MTRLRNPAEGLLVAALLALGAARPGFAAGGALLFAVLEIAAGLRRREGPRWLPSIWPVDVPPMTVVYDGTCRLCAASKKRLERWKAPMTFVALQTPEAKTLLPGKSDEELLGQMHVLEEGKVYGGAEGWFRIMRRAPLWSAWIAWITPLFIARPVYGWVARNRYKWFGRTCEGEGGACAVHPQRFKR
jgi:predicted DCC family thiol-disulfide oxidoreductase YuxK